MPNFFHDISPIDPPRILGIRNLSLYSLEIEQASWDISLSSPRILVASEPQLAIPTISAGFDESESFPTISEVLPDAKVPLKSHLIDYKLLDTQDFEYSVGSNLIPLTYENLVSISTKESISYHFDLIQEVVLVTDNLFEGKEILPAESFPAEFRTLSDILEIKISGNLFQSIRHPDKVMGMNYSDRHWKVEKVPTPSQEKPTRRPQKETGDLKPLNLNDVHKSQGRKTRDQPSIWDMIFVLLQPPLTFEKTDDLFLPSPLRPYQCIGVQFLMDNQHALLADDMGTGKTVMTIVALKILMQQNKISNALILCPTSVLYEWERHLDEWAPELVVCLVRGNQDFRSIKWESQAHVYVTTYDTLRSDVQNKLLPEKKWVSFDVVIIDEAHHIKNQKSSRARAIKKLKPRYRWALTGTPVQNKIEDIEALYDFIFPGLLTKSDLSDLQGLMEKIKPFFKRRRKQEVLSELPPKQTQEIWLEMTEEQREIYDRMEQEGQIEIEALGSGVSKTHIFAIIQKLKQICNFLPNNITSPKLDALKEQVEEIIESGNKLIVFSQYVQEGVNKIENALRPFGTATIVGGQSDSVRRNEINKFKRSDKIPILIASVISGGEGLNLVEASYVVHFDHWWNPAVMWQAEDRVHRRGQEHKVNIYSYWMKNSIDERIYNILKRKGLLIENVVDGLSEKRIEESLTWDDFLEMAGFHKIEQQKPVFDSKKWQSMSFDEIRRLLFEIEPREFEELVMELMHYLGYPNVKVTKATGDGGIDVISARNTGNGVEKVVAQCKRYKETQSVGSPIAREFFGAIKDDKNIVKGFLITTSTFTPECINFCYRNGIELIPGLRIAEYVKKFGLKV